MRREVHIGEVLVELGRKNLLPAITFRTARAQCDTDVQQASSSRRLHLPIETQRELRAAVKDVIVRYDMDRELIVTHPHYSALVTTGVGAHHAGQLLMWRLLLEELMAAGLLRVLVATGTVAAGVDFPARSVVITADSRRGADGYSSLTAAEFQQMSGRAGRRGKDTVGFCIAAPSPFCDARTLLKISKKAAEPLLSAYFPSPSTVLNLCRYRNVDDLRYTVERSLASFVDRKSAEEQRVEARETELRLQEFETERGRASEADKTGQSQKHSQDEKRLRKKVKRLYRQADEMDVRQKNLLESALLGLTQLGYLEGESLSEKGYWAANLCTSIVLELAEIIASSLLDSVTAERLVAIIASISGDEHRKYLEPKQEVISELEHEKLTEILQKVTSMGMPGVVGERVVLPAAANLVLQWMNAESWNEFRGLLFLSGVAEGDAARLITQTAEHLNQITRLMDTHRELALRAEEGKRRILRPPLTEVMSVPND